MTFKTIVNSTATIPYDVNDNFLYVANGSIMPKIGVSLEYTTNSYNIGSSTQKFNTLYLNGIVDSQNGYSLTGIQWFEIVNHIISSATANIEFSVDGLGYKNYKVVVIGEYNSQSAGSSNYHRIYINHDSSTSIDEYVGIDIFNGQAISSEFFDYGLSSGTPTKAIIDFEIYGDGLFKKVYDRNIYNNRFSCGILFDSTATVASTITSIKYITTFTTSTVINVGTNIIIYGSK